MMCDRSGKSVACSLASVFMNGVCCSWPMHAEDYKQAHGNETEVGLPGFRHRSHPSDTQKSQFTFHDEDWDLDMPVSTLQDERRRSVMLAKMGAVSGDRLHLSHVASEERDNETGFFLSSPASNSTSRWVRSERGFQSQCSRNGSPAGLTRSVSWCGTHPKMPATPMSDGSLIDLDEEDESEVELVDQSSLVDVPF
jgi:hypothetical protein